jgi:hypothetical protein
MKSKSLNNRNARLIGSRLLIGLALLVSASALPASQLVQVALTDLSQLERLQRAGFDVSYYSPGGLAEVILMNDSDRDRLNATGLRYFVTVNDLEAFNASRITPGRDDMGGYRTLNEIIDEMNRLHEAYPEVISEPIEFGRTGEDRPMLAFKVSDNPDDQEDEPQALITSLIHCREVVTSYVLFAVAERLAEGYGQDERLTMLVDERETWFVPVVNPDGYAWNEESSPNGGGMWRKNRRRNEDGSIGVDLNRNFGSHWGFDDVGSSPSGGSETYRGTAAFSENETQSIRELVSDQHFTTSLFFHSYSNLCLYPIGYDVLQPPDRSLFSALAKRMTAVNHYLPGTGWEVIYRTNGDSDDWMYSDDGHDPVFGFTVEVGSRQDYFWPPLDRVEPLVNENIETVLTLIDFADRPHRVLEPKQPEITRANITPQGRLSLAWVSPEDEENAPVSYRIRARLPGEPVVDDAPADDVRWERVNFSISQQDRHSGTYSYRAALQQPMSTMSLRKPIVAPDTIYAWIKYNLNSNRGHCIALEASEDGWSWDALPGELTRDFVVNNQSIGEGITGNSNNNWRRTFWRLDRFAGQVVKLRFRFYSFNSFSQGGTEFFFVDDITPLPSYEWTEELASGVEGLDWEGRVENAAPEVEYFVEAIDADGDTSFYSLPVNARELEAPFVLRADFGWSLISVPVVPEEEEIDHIFRSWVDDGILILLKDGDGRFFSPARNFNQIEAWNPRGGYNLRLQRSDTLVIPGSRVEVSSPIPLRRSWNMIGYLPEERIDAPDAWETVRDNLIIGKDGYGQFWIPAFDFNNLPLLSEGKGYQLFMAEADTLVYPDRNEGLAAWKQESNPLPAGFSPTSPDNMSLLIELPEGTPAGWIRLYDSSGKLSGGSRVNAGDLRIGAAVWGEGSVGEAGFGEGEVISAEFVSDGGGVSKIALIGDDREVCYLKDGFERVTGVFDRLLLPVTSSVEAFPNPFNARTTLNIRLDAASDVSLEVTDAAGRVVESVQLSKLPAGISKVEFDGSSLPTGLYICRMGFTSSSGMAFRQTKLVLLK